MAQGEHPDDDRLRSLTTPAKAACRGRHHTVPKVERPKKGYPMSRLMEMRQRVHDEAAVLRQQLADDGADGYTLAQMTLSNRKASDLAKTILDHLDGLAGPEFTPLTYSDPTATTAIRNVLRARLR